MTKIIPSFANYEKYLLPTLVLVTLTVYLPALWCGFVDFDDPAMVVNNLYVQSGFTIEGIRWAFTTGYMANWIPLSWLSHMIDVQLFGMNPAAHHATNVFLHIANTMLLFLFLKKTSAAPWQSAAIASLFALHPLHVESVAWIAERKDVLSGFFWMLTLYAYCRYIEKPEAGRYLTVLGVFALGLLAKPMLVTLPVILLFLDLWPFGRVSQRLDTLPASKLRIVAEKIPLLLLSLFSSLITYWAQSADGVSYQGYTLAARAGRACVSYLTYLWMTVWPLNLAVIYPFDKYPPTQFKMLGSLLILLFISVLAFCLRRRFPYLLVGWGWYLISLLPVIGLIQIGQHSVADRYTYLPLIGIFIMISWGIADLRERWNLGIKPVTIFSVILLLLLATITLMQVRYWKNSYTLFSRAVAVTQGNWVAHHNLGRVLQDQGKTDDAIIQFLASIKAKPSYPLPFLGIGVAYHQKREYPLAVQSFKSALMFEPGMLQARLGLGLVYLDMGEKEKALEEYQTLKNLGSPYADELMQWITAHPTR